MKKTALLLAVLAVLGAMVASGPALAASNFTNTSSLGSASFGFSPTAADLLTFTTQSDPNTHVWNAAAPTFVAVDIGTQVLTGNGLPTCVAQTGGLSCQGATTGNGFVPIANRLPGAFTSRPDKVVSSAPDFGCGDDAAMHGIGAACVEGPPSTGINTYDRVIAVDGHNTAPAANPCGGTVCATDGTLVGNLHSVVALENLGTTDMPSGSIVFDWNPGVLAGNGTFAVATNGSATIDQTINHSVDGLYSSFVEHDYTENPFLTYGVRNFGLVADAGETAGTNFGELYPEMENVNLRADFSVSQFTMGGDSAVITPHTETIGYSIEWSAEGVGGHPGGVYFTTGLNVRDWIGNGGVPVGAQNPPGDGLGFAN